MAFCFVFVFSFDWILRGNPGEKESTHLAEKDSDAD
jgi:hypothetical protein